MWSYPPPGAAEDTDQLWTWVLPGLRVGRPWVWSSVCVVSHQECLLLIADRKKRLHVPESPLRRTTTPPHHLHRVAWMSPEQQQAREQ